MIAEEVLSATAPTCTHKVYENLRREQIITAADLAELDKDDLKELGLSMKERNAVLRWARQHCSSRQAAPPFAEPSGEVLHLVESIGDDGGFWYGLLFPSGAGSIPPLLQELRGDMGGSRSLGKPLRIRNTAVEECFDITYKRVRDVFRKMPRGCVATSKDLVVALQYWAPLSLRDGAASLIFERVLQMRSRVTLSVERLANEGLHVDELLAIVRALKMAQLLYCNGKSSDFPPVSPGRMLVMDYNEFDSHITRVDDIAALNGFLFGHRKSEDSTGLVPVRWIHLSGCHLMMLLALAVKYRVDTASVESIVEQRPTRMEKVGPNYFVTVDHLCLVGNDSVHGENPVAVRGRHCSIICAGSPRFDTFLTVAQDDASFLDDWPGSQARNRVEATEGSHDMDLWATTALDRLQRIRSRVREGGSNFLLYHVFDQCADDIVAIVFAFSKRLGRLAAELRGNDFDKEASFAGRVRSVCMEISDARGQLGVVARRALCMSHTARNLSEDPDIGTEVMGNLKEVVTHLEETHEDANHLAQRCDALLRNYQLVLNRERQRQRTLAEERERAQKQREDKQATLLNNILFFFTVFTAIFSPVQFLAGVYGMNFVGPDGRPTIPELTWEHGYLYFWYVIGLYIAFTSLLSLCFYRRLQVRSSSEQREYEDKLTEAALRDDSGKGKLSSKSLDAYVELSGGPPDCLASTRKPVTFSSYKALTRGDSLEGVTPTWKPVNPI